MVWAATGWFVPNPVPRNIFAVAGAVPPVYWISQY